MIPYKFINDCDTNSNRISVSYIQYNYFLSKTKIFVGYCLHFQVLHHPFMKFKIKSNSMSKLDLVRTEAKQKYLTNKV